MHDRPDDDDAYHELAAYTLSHGDPAFVHQHVVDAHGAQHATADDKPIRLAFALIGLYLQLERGFTGRQVQRVHKLLGDRTHSWRTFPLPANRGAMTAADVMAVPDGPARDAAIEAWCRSVWSAYAASKPAVEALLRDHGVI
jgi:uncharacterized protein DUF5946